MGRDALNRRNLAALLTGALFGAPLLAPLTARAQGDTPNPTTAPLFDPSVGVGAGNDLYSRLTAPVTLNEQGPYDFVIDTGANHSVLSSEIAEALNLRPGRPIQMNTVVGIETVPTVIVDRVNLGGRLTKKVAMAVLPQAAIGGAGLMGVDQLAGRRLTMDFKSRRLLIQGSGSQPSDSGAIAVQARFRDGRLTLLNAQASSLDITVFLDSGSEITVGNTALRRKLGARLRPLDPSRFPDVPVIAATGAEINGSLGVLPMLKIGGLTVFNMPMVFADLHTFSLWGAADIPALLVGVDLLREFASVDLDFGSGQVLFHLPGWQNAPTGTLIRGI
ncbi:putative aspartyl protease [Caulobacter ginsengisoli]|uniref:Aspartyl protease n=1 Tax=Caulobacter ginsengisoli TaxID=400775 RepID=A0ABU0IWM2_9CAUL|nr:aspartyl protease family protein [Caulobacter ginsengisoli]MDQ0465765.1 putative aspartyl protease [Caulobacter ginsengisoli]